MKKTIVIDTSTLFFPAVFSFERQVQLNHQMNTNNFVMPAHVTYFYSVLSCLKKIGVDEDTKVIMALEGKSWRKSVAGYYKAQRAGDRDAHKLIDWDKEFKNLNKINDTLNEATDWYFVREWDSESDDVCAVACRYYKNDTVVIATCDKDLHQLAYYENVLIFNVHKKCKGSKGMYDKVDDPLKIIADKVRMGDISDNIIVDKVNDTELDEQLRFEIINLLELPDYVENGIREIFDGFEKKELNLDKLPSFRNAREKFLKIYEKEKIVTPEYCYKLAEKRKATQDKKIKDRKLEKKKIELKDVMLEQLSKAKFNGLKRSGFLKEVYPDAPEIYEDINKKGEQE